jgi:hypothetical protein
MAIVDTRSTFSDLARATDPNGAPAQVYEIMDQVNPILMDAPAYPSNAPLGNRVTIRTSLPTVQGAKINKGTTKSKGTTEQRTDAIGLIDGRSEFDRKIRKTMGSEQYLAERQRQDRGFAEALAQYLANLVFYGNVSTDETAFDGLATRMATSNAGTTLSASQVWLHSGSQAVVGSDGTSMFVVDWGKDSCHLIYPAEGEGSGGLDVENIENVPVLDQDSVSFQGDVTQYLWAVGLTVKDPRHIARIANIDVSDANIASPLQGTLIDRLIDVLCEMPPQGNSTRVIYAHRRLHAAFIKQANNKSNVHVLMAEYLGKMTPHYDGIPIRRSDAISVAETTVS